MPSNAGWHYQIVMFIGNYVPWDHYPQVLRFTEVQDPLSVIAGYFSGARPQGHFRDLKVWRHYVVTAKHYRNREGPGALLFISNELLRLLEACYLLSLSSNRYELKRNDLFSVALLERAKAEWPYYPDCLSQKELRNPYRVLKKIFKDMSLATHREYIKEWLHAALYKNALDETMTSAEVISVYSNMKRLISAAWVIHQLEIGNTMVKPVSLDKDGTDSPQLFLQTDEYVQLKYSVRSEMFTRPFDPQMTAATKLALDEVLKVIIKCNPNIQSVIYLGAYGEPVTFYLLVQVADTEKQSESLIREKLENDCRKLVDVFIIAHKVQSSISGIKKGSRFWKAATTGGISLYKSAGHARTPVPTDDDGNDHLKTALAYWQRWSSQGQVFLEGARRYIDEGNFKLGLFLLHQAAESTLIGVIKVLCGYRDSGHNLARLLRFTGLFTGELIEVFELHDVQAEKVFNLLCCGYSEARYKDNFDAAPDLVKAAQLKIDLLLKKSAILCSQILAE